MRMRARPCVFGETYERFRPLTLEQLLSVRSDACSRGPTKDWAAVVVVDTAAGFG